MKIRIPIFFSLLILVSSLMLSCGGGQKKLPLLGPHEIENSDTTFYTIPEFSFINQDSVVITHKDYEGKIYIADFFFTSCRTICPTMNIEMKRVHDVFQHEDRIGYLSHTIDPETDNTHVLKNYADGLEADPRRWNFVTGRKVDLYHMAQKGYYVSALEDAMAEDGIVHSAAIILIDDEGHIRGYYDGTKHDAVTRLIGDLRGLLKE